MNVLFVCLGNICRSPTAEAIFRKKVTEAGLQDQIYIDSCGTSGTHTGELSDIRTRTHSEARGYNITSTARGLDREDLEKFDYILAMDENNLADILKLDTNDTYRDKVQPMVSYCTNHKVSSVPDPYFGGPDGFETVLDILEDACSELLKKLQAQLFATQSQRH